MIKFFKSAIIFISIALTFFLVVPNVFAGYDHYTINVYKNLGYTTTAGGNTQITSGVQYLVLNGGTDTRSTIYSDAGSTAITNPVSTTVFDAATDIDFYIDDSVTTVDIIVVDTAGGFTLFLDGITSSVKNCLIDERPNMSHQGTFWYTTQDDATVTLPTETGIVMPVGFRMEDIVVETVRATVSSACNIRIGSGATYAGFLDWTLVDGADLWMRPNDYATTADSDTRGSLISTIYADSLAYVYMQTSEFTGAFAKPGYIATAASLNYAIDSADDNTLYGWGYVHFWFSVVR